MKNMILVFLLFLVSTLYSQNMNLDEVFNYHWKVSMIADNANESENLNKEIIFKFLKEDKTVDIITLTSTTEDTNLYHFYISDSNEIVIYYTNKDFPAFKIYKDDVWKVSSSAAISYSFENFIKIDIPNKTKKSSNSFCDWLFNLFKKKE